MKLLRPFEINQLEVGKDGPKSSSKFWYMAPEQLLKAPMKTQGEESYYMTEASVESCERQDIPQNNMAADLWSLGCIFAELFATVTPLFQSIDNKDSGSIYFKVIKVKKCSLILFRYLDCQIAKRFLIWMRYCIENALKNIKKKSKILP